MGNRSVLFAIFCPIIYVILVCVLIYGLENGNEFIQELSFLILIIFTVVISGLSTHNSNNYDSNAQFYEQVENDIQISESHVSKDERIKALKEAQIYLKPYTDIFNNLELSNRYCSLKLKNGIIYGIEKYSPDNPNAVTHNEFTIKTCNTVSIDTAWNMYCRFYAYNTHYDGLIGYAELLKATIDEKVELNKILKTENKKNIKLKQNNNNKTDINNCSEIEMTALNGINIVMAKKAIKKREEIGGFKNIEDFILFLHIKPHMAEHLRNTIYISDMKGCIHQSLHHERSVDL